MIITLKHTPRNHHTLPSKVDEGFTCEFTEGLTVIKIHPNHPGLTGKTFEALKHSIL
jgi:hypothetical protein